MQWNLTTTLVVIGVFLVGYTAGLVEMHIRRAGKIKKLEAALADAEREKEALKDTPAPQASPQPNTGGLRIWDDDAGNLSLELDSTTLQTPASITPEQRGYIIKYLKQLRPWIEGPSVTPAAPVAKPAVPVPAPAAPVSQPAPEASTPAAEPVAPAAPKSIVGQIDEVLQTRLVNTPLAARRIRLTETITGGIRVYVGSNFYEEIDAVPDPEVVTAIRAAIAEWEKTAG